MTDRGKGSYWTIDESIDPRTGVHRVRKRSGKLKREDTGGLPSEVYVVYVRNVMCTLNIRIKTVGTLLCRAGRYWRFHMAQCVVRFYLPHLASRDV